MELEIIYMDQFRLFNQRFFLTKSSQCARTRPIKSADKRSDSQLMIFPDYFRNTTETMRTVHTSCQSRPVTHFSNATRRLLLKIRKPNETVLDISKNLSQSSCKSRVLRPNQRPMTHYYRIQQRPNYLFSDYTRLITLLNGVTFRQMTPTASICRSNNGVLVKEILKSRRWWAVKEFNNQPDGSLVWTQKKLARLQNRHAEKCSRPLPREVRVQIGLKGHEVAVLLGFDKVREIGATLPPYFSDTEQFFATIPCSQVLPRLHNHIPDPSCLCKTHKLLGCLLETFQNLKEVIPKTFLIKHPNQVLELIKDINSISESGILFLKQAGPSQNFTKVCHIPCTKDALLSALKKSKKGEPFLIQQFIKPLIRQQNMYQLHTYLLITIVDGFVKAYWYADGYATVKNYEWFKFQPMSAINRQSLCQLLSQGCNNVNKVLFEDLCNVFSADEMAKMKDNMAEIASRVAKASYHTLNEANQSLAFQIFEMRFVVGEGCRVLLSGVRQNPSFEQTEWSKQLIPNLIENTFKIAVDPIFPSPYDEVDPSQFYRTNKFRLVFDQLQ